MEAPWSNMQGYAPRHTATSPMMARSSSHSSLVTEGTTGARSSGETDATATTAIAAGATTGLPSLSATAGAQIERKQASSLLGKRRSIGFPPHQPAAATSDSTDSSFSTTTGSFSTAPSGSQLFAPSSSSETAAMAINGAVITQDTSPSLSEKMHPSNRFKPTMEGSQPPLSSTFTSSSEWSSAAPVARTTNGSLSGRPTVTPAQNGNGSTLEHNSNPSPSSSLASSSLVSTSASGSVTARDTTDGGPSPQSVHSKGSTSNVTTTTKSMPLSAPTSVASFIAMDTEEDGHYSNPEAEAEAEERERQRALMLPAIPRGAAAVGADETVGRISPRAVGSAAAQGSNHDHVRSNTTSPIATSPPPSAKGQVKSRNGSDSGSAGLADVAAAMAAKGANGSDQAAQTTSAAQSADLPPGSTDDSGAKVVPAWFEDADPDDIIILVADMLSRLVEHNDRLPLHPSSLTRFHSRAAPQISILSYLRRIAKYTSLEKVCTLILLIYIDRVSVTQQGASFTICSLTVHRFVCAATVCASKALCDAFSTNGHYAKVGGISLIELNMLEKEFLNLIGWSLVCTSSVLQQYYASLVHSHPGFTLASAPPESTRNEYYRSIQHPTPDEEPNLADSPQLA